MIVPESIACRFEVLTVSIVISITPTASITSLVPVNSQTLSASSSLALKETAITVTRRLLDNFINYTLSYSRTFGGEGTESYVPAKTITDWYNNTLKKIQNDSIGFFNTLLRKDE